MTIHEPRIRHGICHPRNSNSALSKGDKTLSHCVGALAHSFHMCITQTDHDQKDQGFLTLFYKFLCNDHQSAVLKRKSHSFYGRPSWSGELEFSNFPSHILLVRHHGGHEAVKWSPVVHPPKSSTVGLGKLLRVVESNTHPPFRLDSVLIQNKAGF
jgi:hypothetical protein